MNPETSANHAHAVNIGTKLGFRASREVKIRPARTDTKHYGPVLDVLWSLPLTSAQLKAIAAVGALVPMFDEALPIAAWEIEGTDASTKGMQADAANIRASGAPFGFLAVNSGSRDNLLERAQRLARTQAAFFGEQSLLPFAMELLPELAQLELDASVEPLVPKAVTKPGGGEGKWAASVRPRLEQLGKDAGFHVRESYVAPSPKNSDRTKSQIDMAWTLRMPGGLRDFVEAVANREPGALAAKTAPFIDLEKCDEIVVVAFELENDAKKHGYGGLLNLSSHGMAGVFVAGNAEAEAAAKAALATYSPFFPLSRVTVRSEDF